MAPAILAMTLAADPAWVADLNQWRRQREVSLIADDGWTTVAGLFWLKEGRNTFGSDPASDLVFPASAPKRAGYFEHREGRTVVRVGDAAMRPMTPDDPGPPTIVEMGDLSFFVILRNGRHAIRLRDRNSKYRREFTGLQWYPPDLRYRVEARFTPYPAPKTISVPTVLDYADRMESPGFVTFRLDGRDLRLEPVTAGDRLWFIFRDRTSTRETYGGGRFLYADRAKDGVVVLDFNRAYNPPCAYTPYATCPLPPPQNRLDAAIRAGEKNYHYKH
jgi:uncharacterized protein (DUF1684 family)